jgi:hypothetical protein
VDGVIGIRRFAYLVFAFGKERFRHDIFFRCPIPEIQQAATLAAKRKIRACLGIGQALANGAPALHET